MSLQAIELNPLAISELYRNVLVSIDAVNAVASKAEIIEVAPARNMPSKGSELPVQSNPQPETIEATVGEVAVIDTIATKNQPLPKVPEVTSIAAQVPLIQNETVLEDARANVSEPASSNSRIKFLGGNKKRIAFIVHSKTDVFLPDNHLDWLGKMLDACRLNLGDVAIANLAKNQFTIADIKQELFSNIVVLLGPEPSQIQLPLNFPHFNLQPHDGITFLATPPPDQLNKQTPEAKLLKSKLWVSLQKLFKL